MNQPVRPNAITHSNRGTFEHCANKVRCPAQIVLIDQPNGPADIVLDIVARLYGGTVSIVRAEGMAEALDVLHDNDISVAVFGLPDDQPNPLWSVARLRAEYPTLPTLVVSYDLGQFSPAALREHRKCTGFEAVELPARSADLKRLVDLLIARYLDCI